MERKLVFVDKAREKELMEAELRQIRDGVAVRFFQRLWEEAWAGKAKRATPVSGCPDECW